jgi:hypothetical protein
MANTLSSFFQTLVAEMTEAAEVLVGTTALMEHVYKDYAPIATSVGQTLNIALPPAVTSSVADAGVADPTFTDVSFTTKSIVFNKHPQFGYAIHDFEQFNSPAAIRQLMVDPAIKGVAENINAAIAALLTAGNFNVNSVINTTGGATTPISTAQFLTGYANLATQKVPVTDTPNVAFLQPPLLWANMLGNTNWTQESIVGVNIAEEVRKQGILRVAYGAKLAYDQQLPVSGTTPNRTFTSAYFHRYAIALATRPLPKPDPKVSEFTYVDWKGIPLRVTLGYSVQKSAWLVNVDAGYGVAVVRPEMGQLFSTAE